MAPQRLRCGKQDCPHQDPDAAFDTLAPGCSCCTQDHHHGQAAGACQGGHGPCPTPDDCPVWQGMQPHLDGSPVRDTSAGPCPGGHCGAGVDGCTVCRPLKITVLPGSAQLHPVTGMVPPALIQAAAAELARSGALESLLAALPARN